MKNNQHNHSPSAYKKSYTFSQRSHKNATKKVIINPLENGKENHKKKEQNEQAAYSSDDENQDFTNPFDFLDGVGNMLEPETSIEIKKEPIDLNYPNFYC